jgi:hypothetical protein
MDAVYEPEELLAADDVPLRVRESLESRFAGASNVVWKFDEDVYEASFTWEGKEEVEAYYDATGRLERAEFPVAFEDLPAKAQAYVRSQNGLKVEDIEQVEKADASVQYEVQLDGHLVEWDCLFDAEGNLLTRERDGPLLEPQPVPEGDS